LIERISAVSEKKLRSVEMAIPDTLRLIIESTLISYSEQRIPPHVRDKVRLSYQFRGNTVTLSENRPVFQRQDEWTVLGIAQFRYDPGGNRWTLYWADRNFRWHKYEDLEPNEDFDRLLQEIDEDPTGIFWG
jgi:hypothetical protein